MKKWHVTLALTLLFLLSLSFGAFAAASKPEANTEVDKITVAIPYIPGLEITFTDVPHIAGEHQAGSTTDKLSQLKFYFGKNTTFAFNHDVTLEHYSGQFITCKAGVPIKAYDYESIGAFDVTVITSSDGTFELTNSNNTRTVEGQYVIYLCFASVGVYSYNMTDEGYTPVDITAWRSANSAVTAPAAAKSTGKVAKVSADYDKDGKADYTYKIPNTISSKKVSFVSASQIVDKTDPSLPYIAGKNLASLQ